jgi:DNA-binding MarR family transcriptional regulator/GNAT superfamily N-acetyltransferase
MPVTPTTIDTIRRFNRFYTKKIGVLNSGLLDSPFSLTEVRVLYELAQHPGVTATALGGELGLDPGYLSRILARFAKQRLIQRTRAKHDGRQTKLQLSALGQKTFAGLDHRSSEQITQLVGHLSPADQERLGSLLGSVSQLLSSPAEKAGKVSLREPRAGDYGWVVQRHGALYAAEYGWDTTFEALVARIVADFAEHRDPRRERAWIAEWDGQPVGCIFLVRDTDEVAKLRLLLVEPGARGRGVGHKLVDACLAFAREAGYRKVTLWTNDILHAARRIYEQAGFKLVQSERHHSFGHDLVGQNWELNLPPA